MTPSAETGLATMLAIVGGVGLLIGIAVYVWYALALSRLFPRIDGEGWKGWVPVLNEAEILARGGVPAWSVVFYFIPLVQLYGLYLKVVATHRINRRFGRGAGMTVLAILLPPVWATVLAWGAPPYPEGDRLDALQPGPRRTPQPSAAPARDASGYTIPSLAPHGATPSQTSGLVFPDYAAPPMAEAAPPAAAAAPNTAAAAPRSFAPPASAPQDAPAAPAAFAPPPAFAAQPPAFVAPQTPASEAAQPPAPAPQPPAPHVAQPPAYAPQPQAPQPPAQAPQPPAPAPQASSFANPHPTTGIMAAMGGGAPTPAAPAPAAAPVPAAPTSAESEPAPSPTPSAEPAARSVRPVPPSFRTEGADAAQPQAPTIRPVPNAVPDAVPASDPGAEGPPAPAVAQPAAPASLDAAPAAPADPLLGGLSGDVDRTVVTPRPADDDLDATVVVARRRGVRRSLVLDDGRTFALSGASVVIGRNPIGDLGEQRLAISDTTRTLSKTHARLVVHEDEWRLTDLHATNGVVVVGDDGTETLLDPGESVIGNGRFILGEVGMHVVAERDS